MRKANRPQIYQAPVAPTLGKLAPRKYALCELVRKLVGSNPTRGNSAIGSSMVNGPIPKAYAPVSTGK